ncbi:serine carboxypeptidase-domain-containing protein, partial [Blyttiomyces helicus]
MRISTLISISCLTAVAAAANLPSRPIIQSGPRRHHASLHHEPSGRASDYLIKNLPNIPTNVTDGLIGRMYSGNVPVLKDGASLFFWYIASPTPSKDLVVWLNGGPGCSSLLGAFEENGPIRVANSSTGPEWSRNPYSWDNAANVLYVEQPVGTGFAFANGSDFATNEITVGENFYTFLNSFYDIFPETLAHRLYITGESYAGMYIPYITATLAEKNILTNGRPIPLAGILVGDGVWNWTIQNDLNLAGHFFEETNFFAENRTYLDQIYETAANCSGIDPAYFSIYWFPNNTNGCFTGLIPQQYLNIYKPGMQFNVYDIFTDGRETAGMDNHLQEYFS